MSNIAVATYVSNNSLKSIGLHTGIIVLFIVTSYISQYFSTSNVLKISIVESAVKVDIVAMPKMTLKELKVINTSFDSIEEDEPVVKKNETSQIDFLEKRKSFISTLKQLGDRKIKKSAKRLKKVGKSKNVITKSDRRAIDRLVLAGNKLSKGTAIVGSGNAEDSNAFELYSSSLADWVRPHWDLPSYLQNKEYQCRIRIHISPTGKLINATVYESSGDNEYDEKALKAVRESDPFPSVSEDIKKRTARGDIILGFPL